MPSLAPNPLSASEDVILIEQDLLSEQIHAYTSNAYTSSSSVKNRGPRNCLSFDEALQQLRTYHSTHNHLVIPRSSPLAKLCYDYTWWQDFIKDRPERVTQLNEIDFIWGRLQSDWNILIEALCSFKSLHSHIDVPSSFVVPHSPPFPISTWSLPLGRMVSNIRLRNFHINKGESRVMQLDGLGFVWHRDRSEQKFQMTMYAAREYKVRVNREGRALKVPQRFVVPENGKDEWPLELAGFRLGEKLSAIRQKGLYVKNHPKRRQQLEELGFQWAGNSSLNWLEVVHAAAIYSSQHDRVLNPPDNFVCEGDAFPDYLHGLPLGLRLKDVRLRGRYLQGEETAARR
ncbi:hypothetical protein TL16_g04471 [Triparma laevis f. inornata]|uniref:Helicase-associated domain-containing protein n=1 Tax=Triparma laevis f. inornata TaxID=1714386 RepID=A0A9W7E5P7_9STRA|nr:hypothetical protein TL16_g04471 [Triparma laevis f. inornata]